MVKLLSVLPSFSQLLCSEFLSTRYITNVWDKFSFRMHDVKNCFILAGVYFSNRKLMLWVGWEKQVVLLLNNLSTKKIRYFFLCWCRPGKVLQTSGVLNHDRRGLWNLHSADKDKIGKFWVNDSMLTRKARCL